MATLMAAMTTAEKKIVDKRLIYRCLVLLFPAPQDDAHKQVLEQGRTEVQLNIRRKSK